MSTFVILAAGKSTRYGKNKLLEKVKGLTLPERCVWFDINNGATRICVTVSEESDALCNSLSSIFPSVEIEIQNPDKYGPAAALLEWKDKINEEFFVLFGDNYYEGVIPEINKDELAVTYKSKKADVRNLQFAAIVDKKLIEKPHNILEGDYFCGFVHFPENYWSIAPKLKPSSRNEYEITDMINNVECKKIMINYNEIGFWSDITYPDDIEIIENELKKRKNHGT